MGKIARGLLLTAPCVAVLLASQLCLAVSDCVYSGVNFSNGAVSCQSGHEFKCNDGDWIPLDSSCAAPAPAPTVSNPAVCKCTEEETGDCDRQLQGCCVSLEEGNCIKRCCERQ
jgi:hypothetical protein